MSARVESLEVSGFAALALENDGVRAVVFPSLGGRIWELTDRRRDRQWIWHRDSVPLAACGRDASYDDVWAGGWEELFPNDAPGEFEGRSLPDHGIWWTTPWNAEESREGSAVVVRLTSAIDSPACDCVKEILLGDDDVIRVRYAITSRERDPFHFLFKQHLPVALTPACRLALPGGYVTPVDEELSTLSSGATSFDWPFATGAKGERVDLRVVSEADRHEREFVYVRDLPQAWCGVDDLDRDASIRMRYDSDRFPFIWLFLTYAGWRDCYTAVLEPCTNMPKDLRSAVALGQSARLMPSATFETEVSVAVGGAERTS